MSWEHVLGVARETAHRRSGDSDLRVWVPGCGDGLPAYLIASALAQVLGDEEYLARVHVCGTDTSLAAVHTAREGRFAPDRLDALPDDVVARSFTPDGGERVFREDLRRTLSFARNDLERDRPVRRLDLLDAHGVLGAERQGLTYDALGRLVSCLRPGGLLYAPELEDGDRLPIQLAPVGWLEGTWERPLVPDAPDLGTSWRPQRPIRMVVVNEHALFVRGLGLLLESMFGRFVTVVATAQDPTVALELIAREQPDLVLVDISGPRSSGLPREIRQRHPGMPVLALAEDPHEAWREVVAGGSAGVVPRSVSPNELVGPLLAVAEGLSVLPPEAVRSLVRGVSADRLELLDELDDEMLQLWAWVADGLQDNEIAERLYVSSRTVKRRIGSLLRTLEVSRRVEAAELAGRLGLLARQRELSGQPSV